MWFDEGDDDDQKTPAKPDEGGAQAGNYDQNGLDIPGEGQAMESGQL